MIAIISVDNMVVSEQIVGFFIFLFLLLLVYIYLQTRVKKEENLLTEENKEPLLHLQFLELPRKFIFKYIVKVNKQIWRVII